MSALSPSASHSASPHAAPFNSETGHKRRKLRKGTHSCWECKRRKIRCIFAPSDDETCTNCRRRGKVCAGQELPETVPPKQEHYGAISEGIVKVQSLLSDLASKLNADASNTGILDASARSNTPPATTTSFPVTPTSNVDTISGSASAHLSLSTNEEAISASLLAAFPSRQDTETLLRSSKNMSFCCQMINSEWQCMMTKEEFDEAPIKTPTMPNSKTHPVILARLMLACAVFLQSAWYHRHYTFSKPPHTIKERLVTAAIKLVTTNSELHGSLDSLECIMMEGLFHTHAGNLRRAWSVYRTAISSAQLMGIHRFPNLPLKRIDPEATFYPEMMWLRIVYMDRYLSLLLGLPQGTNVSSTSALMPSLLEPEPPIRKLQRSLSTIAGRILERNELGLSSYSQDQIIDAELLKASQSMPGDFWRPPSYDGVPLGSFEEAQETIRLISQVFYFYLLNQLHLPYMLSFIHSDRFRNVDRHEDYSTITCANASREILNRFIAYRNVNHMALCFRPVDFTTLTAVLTLLLAHLDIHLSLSQGDSTPVAKNFLAHQRLSDRILLEQVLQKLDLVSQYHNDAMSIECAKLMRSLLKIEAAAAQGEDYHWTPTDTPRKASSGAVVDESDGGDIVLRISIACLGDIRISRKGCISKVFSDDAARFKHPRNSGLDDEVATGVPLGQFSSVDISELPDGNQQQNWDVSNPSVEQGEDYVSEQMRRNANPTTTTGRDDWALQGVDLAFFDTLMMDGLATFDQGFEGAPH
ncbi:uncharacterized protein BDZ99DRAFT_455333 [Mytilinidion resinicola]|uniref:Zn(2)-C6 fungal-type domain-containing protein n=1 Tax=Mytilinidion resinicola TaxID=574789 RepID=A0A6A6Y0L6_9PEZI|nr:uncharacterized protein BDZ99DRAFT_455333 [Mytilinidion resinicola]KAF2802190.1 hypothetical protein BDZ99DRAFT_455333 [Mytilinidion resinicola]